MYQISSELYLHLPKRYIISKDCMVLGCLWSSFVNVPTLGMICSHAGNNVFPRWEQYVTSIMHPQIML